MRRLVLQVNKTWKRVSVWLWLHTFLGTTAGSVGIEEPDGKRKERTMSGGLRENK